MNTPVDFEEQMRKSLTWRNSQEHQQLCQHFETESDRLTEIAMDLLQRRAALETDSNARTVRKELATGSHLHRGFYCPSPIYDIIVGNAHRGKLLKRPTSRSKPTHEYGLDSENRLLWCNFCPDGAVPATEYLVYKNNTVYGITFDACNHPHTITEEIYENGCIKRYLLGLFFPSGGSCRCTEVTCECYDYDKEGLRGCEVHHYKKPLEISHGFITDSFAELMLQPMYRHSAYLFERRDGYLASYSDGTHTYQVHVQRKA